MTSDNPTSVFSTGHTMYLEYSTKLSYADLTFSYTTTNKGNIFFILFFTVNFSFFVQLHNVTGRRLHSTGGQK